jgi:hypothetical protein
MNPPVLAVTIPPSCDVRDLEWNGPVSPSGFWVRRGPDSIQLTLAACLTLGSACCKGGTWGRLCRRAAECRIDHGARSRYRVAARCVAMM